MTSIAPSRWSMSVHSDGQLSLKLMRQVRRYYYILSLPIIALYTLIFCGCISKSPKISTIFLAELRDNTTILRFGYFGICTIDGSNAKCSSTILRTPARIATIISASDDLTNYAIDLQRSISFITPCFSSILFFFGVLNLGVLQVLHFQRRPSLISNQTLDRHIQNLTLATRIILWASAAISLASAHSMYSISMAIKVSTSSKYGSVEGGPVVSGKTMEAMLWATFALTILFNTTMQLSTTDPTISSRLRRQRKLSNLPYIKTDLQEREDNIRKITNATAQRLAVIDTRNQSNQSIRTDNSNTPIYASMAHDSPLNPDFVAYNSPGLQPPLATLQRKPTNPSSVHSRPKPSPLSLAWPNDQQTPLSPLSFLEPSQKQNRPQPSPSSSRRVEVRIPTQHELRQISPGLRGILETTGRGTSSIYSRPATSPKIREKNAWV